MGIPLTLGFDMNAALPLDSRTTVANSTARDAIASGVRYEGMMVYVVADLKTYQLKGGITNLDWIEVGSGGAAAVVTDVFSGNGSTTGFTLSVDPGGIDNLMVYIFGVYQQKATYSVATTTLTFSSAPPTGTNNIEVKIGAPLSIGSPSDNSVTQAKMALRTTGTTVGAGGIADSGSFTGSTSTNSFSDVGPSITITSLGNPIRLDILPAGGVTNSYFSISRSANTMLGEIQIVRGASTVVARIPIETTATGATSVYLSIPACFSVLDFQAAGTYTYKLQFQTGYSTNSPNITINNAKLTAKES